MLSGSEITDAISAEVNEATAEKVRVSFSSTAGGKLSLSGPQTEKVGIAFSVTASAEEAYAFNGWSVSGSGNVRLSSTVDATTTVTIVKAADDIAITGSFAARPKVSETSLENHSIEVSTGEAIVFTFSQEMTQGDFGSTTIAISGKLNGVPEAVSEDFFDSFDIESTSTTLTFTPKPGALASGYRISITISKEVRSLDGVSMAEDKQFDYSTG